MGTHLQRAQPVTVGHHALAYVEMLARDRSRLHDAHERMDTCPLGSAALAGTAFPIDRSFTAAELGFDRPTGQPHHHQDAGAHLGPFDSRLVADEKSADEEVVVEL